MECEKESLVITLGSFGYKQTAASMIISKRKNKSCSTWIPFLVLIKTRLDITRNQFSIILNAENGTTWTIVFAVLKQWKNQKRNTSINTTH